MATQHIDKRIGGERKDEKKGFPFQVWSKAFWSGQEDMSIICMIHKNSRNLRKIPMRVYTKNVCIQKRKRGKCSRMQTHLYRNISHGQKIL